MKLILSQILFLFFLPPLFLVFFSGCASEEKNLSTADGSFKYAKEFDDAERYDMALTKYADVKNKFPYSNLAIEAEIAIAEVHYKRESFAEAQVSFQNFRDMHPKHPKIDYIIYKIAMSYYSQLPETFDRDLSTGNDAIYHFDELIKSYPHSEYLKDAKEKRDDVYQKLTEKELYVADFYFKQKKYAAALRRFEATLKKYSGLGFDPRAHLGAARAAKALENSEKQKYHSHILQTKYLQSDEARVAKLEEL